MNRQLTPEEESELTRLTQECLHLRLSAKCDLKKLRTKDSRRNLLQSIKDASRVVQPSSLKNNTPPADFFHRLEWFNNGIKHTSGWYTFKEVVENLQGELLSKSIKATIRTIPASDLHKKVRIHYFDGLPTLRRTRVMFTHEPTQVEMSLRQGGYEYLVYDTDETDNTSDVYINTIQPYAIATQRELSEAVS